LGINAAEAKFTSEQKLHTKLDMAGTLGRQNATERRRPQKNIGQIKIWPVEEIEKLCPELQAHVLMQHRLFQKRHVEVLKPWSVQNVSAGVTEAAESGHCKGRSVEPLFHPTG
jgi:hypothetical protein